VNLHLLRRLFQGLTVSCSLILAACGGGGASTDLQGGIAVSIDPSVATIYAGVPALFQVAGGRLPYQISSSEPGILAVPATLNGFSFTVLPANPGVVDTGLQPGELPVRSVTITVRDSSGLGAATATVKVAQNFLTGYGFTFISNCPAGTGTGTAAVDACAGGETRVTLAAVFNGALHGDEAFRFDAVRGGFQFETPGGLSPTTTVTSDHSGTVSAFFRVPIGTPSQVGVIRVTEVSTGVTVDNAFVISQQGPSGALTAIPSTITFTGRLNTDCGTGSSDFLVFDGVPPFTAISPTPQISVAPAQSSTNPGRFTVTVGGTSPPCVFGPVIVQDATGARTTVTVTSAAGATAPTAPPTPTAFDVQPNTITLACGTSGSVSAVGGTGSYTATSSHPRITAVVSGSTITIKRLSGDAGVNYPDSGTVTVSDGATVKTVTVTMSPAGTTTCP
jgi:hypothetical protein